MDKLAFMQACRDGGVAIERTLRDLDRACFARLHRECAAIVHDGDIAADLVQETLIKVWRHCASYRGDAELLPWIRVILRRTVFDRLRRGKQEVILDNEALVAAADAAALSSDQAPRGSERDAVAADVQACFDRCWRRFEAEAPAHAAVMAWIVEDGLDNAQIAELLGRSPGATREFISQCRKRARIHFAEWRALAFEGSTA